MEKGSNLRELLQDVPPLDPLLKEGIEETLELFPNYEKVKTGTRNIKMALTCTIPSAK